MQYINKKDDKGREPLLKCHDDCIYIGKKHPCVFCSRDKENADYYSGVKTIYPLPLKEDIKCGWKISFGFLKKIQENCNEEFILEDIEDVLLSLEYVLENDRDIL